MKRLLILASLAWLWAGAAIAQDVYAAGISYNPGATPAVAGTALWAHAANEKGTFTFTVFDALPSTLQPLVVTTNTAAGVAQRVFAVNRFALYIPLAAGLSWNGTNAGWAWNTGALIDTALAGGFRAMPHIRVVRSNVNNGAGYQIIAGVLLAWGK